MTAQNIVYSLDRVPTLQNRVFDSYQQAQQSATGDLRIVQDRRTGLIFNSAFDNGLMKYDETYNNEQSLSPAFQAHLAKVKSIVVQHLGRENLLEVGCGKAFFLKLLREDGAEILGCDPTYEGSDPGIINDFYHAGLNVAQKNIILRHVLEHIPDPLGFLENLYQTNRGGRVYIEVPCLDWIAKNRAWFDMFYEHVNYFRLCDLRAMFANVIESGHLFGGQYLFIVAELASIRKPERKPSDEFRFPADFQPDFSAIRPGIGNVVWGAASKGVIYSLLATRAGKSIEYAIDVNPAKQGRFLPLTGISVISPATALNQLSSSTHVLIMNSNYRDEILQMSNGKFSYSVV